MSDNKKLRETILSQLTELDAEIARIRSFPGASQREQAAKHLMRGRLSLVMSEVNRLTIAEDCSRLKAAVLYRKGKLADAVASTGSPDDPLVHRWTTTAIKAYQESVNTYPDTEACHELAICYARLRRDQEAREALLKAAELDVKTEVSALIGVLQKRASDLKDHASPRAKAFARKNGIDLDLLAGKGTGPGGRIMGGDVRAYLESSTQHSNSDNTAEIFAGHGLSYLPEAVRTEVVDLICRDLKINAIKLVRENSRMGLKEAKDAVEGLALDLGYPQTQTGCFIATACYGDYDHPDVITLCRFRNERLMPSPLGRLFVRAYCRLSPPIAEWLEERPWLAGVLRERLLAGLANRYRRTSYKHEII